jgi:hypothetical protein
MGTLTSIFMAAVEDILLLYCNAQAVENKRKGLFRKKSFGMASRMSAVVVGKAKSVGLW